MEEFPSNSHRSKSAPVTDEKPSKDDKQVTKVVTNKVSQRKKPISKRLSETFFGGDAAGVGQYIMMDVILPAMKDALSDAVSQGIDRILFGESRSSGRTRHARSENRNGFVSYNRFANNQRDSRRDEPRQMSRRARSTHNFDEIVLATRVEADNVLTRMDDLIERYGEATVADLYGLVDITASHTDDKWGWKEDLHAARVQRIRDGYLLNMPRPEPLD